MKKSLLIFAIIALMLMGTFGYYGGFSMVKIYKGIQGGEVLVYEDMLGSYSNTGVVIERVYNSLLKNYNIQTINGFGYYIDSPKKTSKESLRSEIGCILEAKDYDKIAQLEKKYKVRTFPKKDYLVAEFPYRNMGSIFFNMIKVYPALFRHMEKEKLTPKGGVMEIYDMINMKTIFRIEVENLQ